MGKLQQNKMHKRNVFRTPPDYTALAIKYKEFRHVCELQLNGKVSINYKNEEALKQLTKTLLLDYFKLHVDFAPGSLVPTVPLRLNYILWIEDLLQAAALTEQTVHGIDIGCGSSCVYALLAAKKNNWQMTALECNAANIEFAQKNVEWNNLTTHIDIFKQTEQNCIFKEVMERSEVNYTFCLCNPPFFDNNKLLGNTNTRNAQKRTAPSNCATGNPMELSCAGGEVQFVKRIIDESVLFCNRVQIFTSMLGCKSSVHEIKEYLKQLEISNVCETEFNQGNTTRWGIAWSFQKTIHLA